ncbi:hypothetical protein [Natronoflexus pectinivorans]|uniref:Uncharacterized protein n=1 Tax=Natronoflexus pectinivorans TaxID=682526 RepID=A0A4R2GNI5_9BACT|nr:hypothetical protein [Natronoflexus pectinivorans]TCO10855.1 hypothetical protein EV194_101488 [Natronoflexus pectinivorans]
MLQSNITLSENSSFCNQVMPSWTNRYYEPDRFYQSGYELIRTNGNRNEAFLMLLSSITSWDEEVITCGHHKESEETESLMKSLGIVCQPYFEYPDEMGTISQILEARPAISHMVLNINSGFRVTDKFLSSINWLKEIHRLNLIVNCHSEVTGINDVFHGIIDFLVGETFDGNGYVIARRNRLVQTEGNSRSLQLDLYNLWQKQVTSRKAIIEPMDLCEV